MIIPKLFRGLHAAQTGNNSPLFDHTRPDSPTKDFFPFPFPSKWNSTVVPHFNSTLNHTVNANGTHSGHNGTKDRLDIKGMVIVITAAISFILGVLLAIYAQRSHSVAIRQRVLSRASESSSVAQRTVPQIVVHQPHETPHHVAPTHGLPSGKTRKKPSTKIMGPAQREQLRVEREWIAEAAAAIRRGYAPARPGPAHVHDPVHEPNVADEAEVTLETAGKQTGVAEGDEEVAGRHDNGVSQIESGAEIEMRDLDLDMPPPPYEAEAEDQPVNAQGRIP